MWSKQPLCRTTRGSNKRFIANISKQAVLNAHRERIRCFRKSYQYASIPEGFSSPLQLLHLPVELQNAHSITHDSASLWRSLSYGKRNDTLADLIDDCEGVLVDA